VYARLGLNFGPRIVLFKPMSEVSMVLLVPLPFSIASVKVFMLEDRKRQLLNSSIHGSAHM